ncbi:MAG: slipin family protein [Candidatus Riflebacteria bacterium]|nr:slipin family protein [Candidatus Riflebacteria bacterium]
MLHRSYWPVHRIVVAEHERAFVYRDGAFLRVLGPGHHWLFEPVTKVEVRWASQLAPRLDFPDLEALAQDPAVAAQIHTYRIKDTDRGLLFKEGNFAGFLGPGFHGILKTPVPIKVEIVDITEVEVTHPQKQVLVQAEGSARHMTVIDVAEGYRSALLLDSVRDRLLPPGRWVFWTGFKEVKFVSVDIREQALEIQGQELMTEDKVSIRMNLSARFVVADPVLALSSQTNYRDALYRELQLALRDEVGGRTLDALLSRKEDLGLAIVARVARPAEAMGVKLLGAGLKDIILPGEMRTLLNQVIEAEKRALANQIARREETAATRSLMNTAKLLESNPVLMRLKELEVAERVAEKIGSLSVYGGLDGLMDTLRGFTSLAGAKPKEPQG